MQHVNWTQLGAESTPAALGAWSLPGKSFYFLIIRNDHILTYHVFYLFFWFP